MDVFLLCEFVLSSRIHYDRPITRSEESYRVVVVVVVVAAVVVFVVVVVVVVVVCEFKAHQWGGPLGLSGHTVNILTGLNNVYAKEFVRQLQT
jgi:hypothetical protein